MPHESSEEEDDYLAYLKGDDDFLEKYDNEHAKFKAAQRSMEKHQQARVSKVPNVVIDDCINSCPNLDVFLEEFFKKVNFENNQQTKKITKKIPSTKWSATVLPAKSDSDVMFCLQSDHRLIIDRSLVY